MNIAPRENISKIVAEQPINSPNNSPRRNEVENGGSTIWDGLPFLAGSTVTVLGVTILQTFYKHVLEPWLIKQKNQLMFSLTQERKIYKCLAQILIIARADRVLILKFESNEKGRYLVPTHELTSPGISEISSGIIKRCDVCVSKSYEIFEKQDGFIPKVVRDIEDITYRNFLISLGAYYVITIRISNPRGVYGFMAMHWVGEDNMDWFKNLKYEEIEAQFALISDTFYYQEQKGYSK